MNHEIQIQGMHYIPASLLTKKGDTITWVNTDTATHTATSDVLDNGKPIWCTGDILPNATSAPLPASGLYHCKYHPEMKGTINEKC